MAAISFDKLFKAFKENLTATILSLFTLCIIFLFGLLYKSWANKESQYIETIKECSTNVYTARITNDQLRNQYVEVMGSLKEIQGQMKVFKDLGIIK
jgi:hypothetical protein